MKSTQIRYYFVSGLIFNFEYLTHRGAHQEHKGLIECNFNKKNPKLVIQMIVNLAYHGG